MAESPPNSPKLQGEILLPNNYALQKLPLEISLDFDESISCISSFKSNLYVGTTLGQILHYFIFDDAEDYILILQLEVLSERKGVEKFLILPDIEMILVLNNKVIYSYTLPELSPCHIGKIKDAVDMSQLLQVKNPKIKNKHDKIIVFTPLKIRVLQLLPDTVKLLRDIPYNNAQLGFSSAAGTLANYSNICLVANDKNYDVVDLQQTRRISLFEYNPGQMGGIAPHIVPFHAQDSNKEEYMLTICSDEANSMAMFMNSLGDVTRGTLVWAGAGYPKGGVAIEWPHIIGLFEVESETKLAFSSLELLDTQFSVKFSDFSMKFLDGEEFASTTLVKLEEGISLTDLALLNLLSPIRLDGLTVPGHEKQFLKLSILFTGKQSLFCLFQPSDVVNVLKAFQFAVEEGSEDKFGELILKLEELECPENLKKKIRIVSWLVLGNFEVIKELIGCEEPDTAVDPLLVLLRDSSFPDKDEIWTEIHAERILMQILKVENDTKMDPEFRLWFLKHVHANKETYNDHTWQYFRKLLYEDLKDIEQSLKLAESEKSLWQDQGEDTEKLLKSILDRRDYLLVLTILEYQEEQESTEESAREIIDLGLSILSGAEIPENHKLNQGILSSGPVSKNLVSLVFFQLRNHINSSEEYTKKLLELLKLFPDQGLELLQKNKGGKHQQTHRFILQELSSTHNIDKFALLKIEYLEQNFLEHLKNLKELDLELLSELYEELLQYLESNLGRLSDEMENLNILRSTFRIEVDLSDPNWPKLSWIEFLSLYGRKSESQELVDLYLKLYELLTLKALYGQKHQPITIENKAFQYLNNCFDPENDLLIAYLHGFGDYAALEWVAVYEILPLPRKTSYLENAMESIFQRYQKRYREEICTYVRLVLRLYLDNPDKRARNYLVAHLVDHFREYFDITSLMEELPDDFPVIYIQKYLTLVIVELDYRKSDTMIRKSLSKHDAKSSKETHQYFQKLVETLGNPQSPNQSSTDLPKSSDI